RKHTHTHTEKNNYYKIKENTHYMHTHTHTHIQTRTHTETHVKCVIITSARSEGHHGRLSEASTVLGGHLYLVEAGRLQLGQGQLVHGARDARGGPGPRG